MNRDTWLGLVRAGAVMDLRTEAAEAGDLRMVAICDDALECDRDAIRECVRVIREAADSADS